VWDRWRVIAETRHGARNGAELVGEPYQTLDQEHNTAEFGMWIFLATELMLFGGLFTAYTVYRTVYPAGFAEGSRQLDLLYAGPNTAVLLLSSLTMALGVRAAQLGQRRFEFQRLVERLLDEHLDRGLAPSAQRSAPEPAGEALDAQRAAEGRADVEQRADQTTGERGEPAL